MIFICILVLVIFLYILISLQIVFLNMDIKELKKKIHDNN
jgi:hypothetical protein